MSVRAYSFSSFRLFPRRVRCDCVKYKFLSVLYKSLRYLYTSHKSDFSLHLASGSSTRSGVWHSRKHLRWTFSIFVISFKYQGFHEGLPYSNIGRMIELKRISTLSNVISVKHRLMRPIRWFDFLIIVCMWF